MGLLESVTRLTRASTETRYECRNCGTTVTAETDACPACDRTEIAAYEW